MERKIKNKLDLIRYCDELGDPNFRSSQGNDEFKQRKKERMKERKKGRKKESKRNEGRKNCAFCRRALRG